MGKSTAAACHREQNLAAAAMKKAFEK